LCPPTHPRASRCSTWSTTGTRRRKRSARPSGRCGGSRWGISIRRWRVWCRALQRRILQRWWRM
jgi:hypothetical protein